MIDITPVITSLIGIAAIIITAVLIPLIRSKTTLSRQATLQTAVSIAVYAAEQLYKVAGSGQIKKNYVLEYLQERGITYDPNTVNAVLESEVKRLNIAQGK